MYINYNIYTLDMSLTQWLKSHHQEFQNLNRKLLKTFISFATVAGWGGGQIQTTLNNPFFSWTPEIPWPSISPITKLYTKQIHTSSLYIPRPCLLLNIKAFCPSCQTYGVWTNSCKSVDRCRHRWWQWGLISAIAEVFWRWKFLKQWLFCYVTPWIFVHMLNPKKIGDF